MHREISHADQKFQSESRLFLYVFTALIGLLLAANLIFPTGPWRSFAEWAGDNGVPLPKDNLLFGYQLALYAAIIGGARILYGVLDSLSHGASARTWPSLLLASPRRSSRNTMSPPRSYSLGCSANVWNSSPLSGRSAP
jgi:hypothetical protein